MGEYMAKKRTQSRGQENNMAPSAEMTNGIPNSVMQDVFAGKRRATSEMMGHREELAPSIAAKMSQAFGMDLSAMQVYRSDAMAGSSMQGMASGNKIVLGSDVDLNTMEGQAILGHEISHIRAQSMGIGTGNSGLLQNAALEHQADAEGMMAARGMSISGESMGMSMGLGMAGVENLTPLSGGMSASAGAPMQAKKPDEDGDDIMIDRGGQLEKDPEDFDKETVKIITKNKKRDDEKKIHTGDLLKMKLGDAFRIGNAPGVSNNKEDIAERELEEKKQMQHEYDLYYDNDEHLTQKQINDRDRAYNKKRGIKGGTSYPSEITYSPEELELDEAAKKYKYDPNLSEYGNQKRNSDYWLAYDKVKQSYYKKKPKRPGSFICDDD